MADFEELSFVIPGYDPETIPLARLIQYLQQISVVLGDPENLHLIKIADGSVTPIFHASKAVVFEAADRASKVQRGDGTKRQVDALNSLRRMVRRDSRGDGKAALLRTQHRVVLEIPAALEEAGVLSGVRQFSTIDGQLIRVGGAGEDATLQVQELDGRILSGFTAKRTLAKEMARLMWEPIRLSGIGQWCRTAEGDWSLERMLVQSYELLADESLGVTLERLRNLNVAWPGDAAERLTAEREGIR